MDAILKALKRDLAALVSSELAFTPPYFVSGLYEQERRLAIEAPNRATIAEIFKRRDDNQRLVKTEHVQNHIGQSLFKADCVECSRYLEAITR